MWILGYFETIGSVGMESKWIFFVAKKRSPATMPSRFCVRTAFVYEIEGKFRYFYCYAVEVCKCIGDYMLTTNSGFTLMYCC
jgi:hypothetical protein